MQQASLSSEHQEIPSEFAHRSWAEIDLEAIRDNARALRRHAGGAPLLCVVKADGYGHGARAVVSALRPVAQWFAVAGVSEAAQILPELGADDHVLLLGPAAPVERPEVVRRRLIPLLSEVAEARDYSRLALEAGSGAGPLEVHVKVDVAMGRMGLLAEHAVEAILEIHALPGLRLTGLATHLPASDSDPESAREQLARFGELLARLESAGLPRLPWHAQNSAGFLHNLEAVGRAPGWVRPGLALYGVSPTGLAQETLRRALTWKARVVLAREMPAGHGISYGSLFRTERATQVATVSVGYADGYHRCLTGQGADVLIAGRRCPVLGRVTMDLIMVDVTDLPRRAESGDEVILLGKSADGGEEITAEELAAKAGTIPWEIFTSLSGRVHRVYLG